MKYIGIDSAALSGWAFQTNNMLLSMPPKPQWEFGTVRADSPRKYDILKFAKEHGVTHACIEKPMPFSGSAANVGQSMNISYGRWLEACAVEGIEVVPVLVVQWQPRMLVINGSKVPQKLMEGKVVMDDKHGSKTAARHHGANVTNGDEADAVLLCLYGPTARTNNAIKEEAKREAKSAKAKAARKKRKAAK